jgi:hypothetical protein
MAANQLKPGDIAWTGHVGRLQVEQKPEAVEISPDIIVGWVPLLP